jgi:hypothetical protein
MPARMLECKDVASTIESASSLPNIKVMLAHNQGDQIGRIFAIWVIVYLGPFYVKIVLVA